jgi:hypothetical protein
MTRVLPGASVRPLLLGLVLGAAGLAAAAPADDAKKAPEGRDFTRLGMGIEDNRLYLNRLDAVRKEAERFPDDKRWQDLAVQVVGTQASYVGRYREALDSFDRRDLDLKPGKPGSLDGYEHRDAVEAVLKQAGKRQVVMVNEAHHVPMHRAFSLALLEGLYQRGFRYFAAETLTVKDPDLQARGYPTLQTGYYTVEPLYAELVRTALRLGYRVVPYEAEDSTPPGKSDDPNAAQNAREEGQAKNLRDRILAKDPQAKVVVHAGYGHISKRAGTYVVRGEKKGEVLLMAGYFRRLTGIDPLSVDQTLMSEHSKPEREWPDYRLALEKGLVKERPVVLRGAKEGEFFVPVSARKNYDLVVFHPRSRYEDGRPTWLALGGRRRPHPVREAPRPPEGGSLLAQAFYAKEDAGKAVPADQVEYRAGEPGPVLWLPAGEFRVRVVDDAGKTLAEYTTTS